jgi:hypothetical protein
MVLIIVYVILGLILLLLLIAALMPGRFNIEKTIIIGKPLKDTRQRVGDLHQYAIWNPWQQTEPKSTKEITGTPNTPGHRYSWQGKKIGTGSLTLLSLDEQHIHFELAFVKPWKSKAKDNWLFEPWGDGNQTKVTWQNSGELPWPIARLMGPMINKNLGIQFEKGLQNLKRMCEEG